MPLIPVRHLIALLLLAPFRANRPSVVPDTHKISYRRAHPNLLPKNISTMRMKGRTASVASWLLAVLTLFSVLSNVRAFSPALLPRRTSQIHNNSAPRCRLSTDDKKEFTIADLRKQMLENPAKFQSTEVKKKKYRRTRQKVQNPKQQYVYAAQRPGEDETFRNDSLVQAREFGLLPAAQHCDPLIGEEPKIVNQIRVSDENGSGSYAYLIEKPIGWSILGISKKPTSKKQPESFSKKAEENSKEQGESDETLPLRRKQHVKQVKVVDEDGTEDVLEYSELDVLALMTPEELEEYQEELGKKVPIPKNRITPTLKEESDGVYKDDSTSALHKLNEGEVDSETAANLQRIVARTSKITKTASFAHAPRPSVVAWLKDLKAAEGTPIRGGNFWTALAGAAGVDDSGLVLLCPKAEVDNIFVEYAEYVAVVGNGGYLASKSKTKVKSVSNEAVKMDIVSKLRKARGDDTIQTVQIMISERKSTCTSVVELCQTQFKDGIRGDPAANPFDRRARRRLIHCNAMSVSSLTYDESGEAETEAIPDDIAILSERRNHLEYKEGSFLGRTSLKNSPLTNAYREINGAADGFPGWTVDRYDKWLFVQHDPKMPRGPLSSIHDGYTAGVYYLESSPNRSSMGSAVEVRPQLLEGQAAPDLFPVLENGVKYLVSLDRDLSTGIFLDQRPQRAWLTRNCCQDTHVLNCFAHTGAFSVAAAAAGASTVSLDLSKKWLDRLPLQLEANGIEFDERHDAIYGDCFDWLARLAKRGEKYDIVILDPPSSSVGGRKKKRWSIKNDMDELVSLASGLVKKGGLLWTTTNSASIHPVKFARLCRKGLEDAGIESAKVERIQPMPLDFQSIGPQPVKNLVWRIP